MKKANWLFALIALLLLITLMHGANAQSRFRENYKFHVQLVNGRQLRGTIVDASPDSLIILERDKIVMGCLVKIELTHGTTLRGEVVAITDSTLVVRPKDQQLDHVFFFERIKRVTVILYPHNFVEAVTQRTPIPVSGIRKIVVSSKKKGTAGFLLGAVSAAGIGYLLGATSDNSGRYASPAFAGAAAATLLFPIGGTIGSSIARDKAYLIEGNPLRFAELMKHLTKPDFKSASQL